MTEAIVVLVTAGSMDEANRLAESLVGERLAACVNLIPGIRSVYRWQGEVRSDEETLLIVKTERRHFEALESRICKLHSYEVPEVIACSVAHGSTPYLDWIAGEIE